MSLIVSGIREDGGVVQEGEGGGGGGLSVGEVNFVSLEMD